MDCARAHDGTASPPSGLLVGLDLDNTLARLDHVFLDAARDLGFAAPGAPGKKALRGWLRSLPDGEILWRRVQARTYGPLMGRAALFPGVADFLAHCLEAGIPLRIVSHKTVLADQDATGTDLRQAALGFLDVSGLFDPGRSPLRREHVFFASTRAEKLARIAELGCTHFVDDLPELFVREDFPATTTPILFCPEAPCGFPGLSFRTWSEITDHFRSLARAAR